MTRDYIEAIATEFSRLSRPRPASVAGGRGAGPLVARGGRAAARRPGRIAPGRPAARAPRLAARAGWEALAARAEELLASGGEGYWTEARAALRVVAGLDAEERREEKRSCVA